MNVDSEIADLRRRLDRLAGEHDSGLVRRYDLGRPFRHEELGHYRRARMAVGRILRRLGLRRTRPPPPWVPTLKHQAGNDALAVLIWAIGADRDGSRRGCTAIEERRVGEGAILAPVLITDIADFAFYSRLGWLVEFVPELRAPAGDYSARKLRYLAWRYRDAPALPVSAGLVEISSLQELIATAVAKHVPT